jgi:aryl-alcohol dehydrogenase-like predicted oxidoreductase
VRRLTLLSFLFPRKYRNVTPNNIKKDCAGSLKRLGTDYIDVYQVSVVSNGLFEMMQNPL